MGQAPLFREMSLPRRVWEAVGGPLVAGALCGWLLGVSAAAYLVGVVLSFLGGLPAGSQHRTVGGALARALAAGLLWALALLALFSAVGHEASVPLPEPRVVLLVLAVVPSCVGAAVVWAFTRRSVRT